MPAKYIFSRHFLWQGHNDSNAEPMDLESIAKSRHAGNLNIFVHKVSKPISDQTNNIILSLIRISFNMIFQ